MDIDEATRRRDEIIDIVHDDEVAHSWEDQLRHDILETIALNASDPRIRDLAQIGLSTSNIEFARWYD